MGGKAAACTIISKNYLSYARTLTESYLAHNPGGEVYVLLVDKLDGYFDPAKETFKFVELEDIGIEGLNELLFKYSVIELNTAVKPFFMEYIFRTHGVDKLAYLDPDILVLDSLGGLWGLLDDNSIVLTPHLDAPLPDDLRPNEYDILRSGSYNLGFIAVRNDGTFLKWWQEKLRKYCYVDYYKGYFMDQKWTDMVPAIFDGVFILKDPGYNTAYWNLHNRRVESRGGKHLVNGRPAVFFHFSGFNPGEPDSISKHQNRYSLDKREDLKPLFYMYSELLLKNGYAETSRWPYAFSAFDNGVEIHGIFRRVYGYLPEHDAAKFGDPFKTGEHSFYNWLNGKVGAEGGWEGMKRLWREVFKARLDARLYYPDPFANDWPGFVQWCLSVSEAELKFPEVFLPDKSDRDASAEIISLRKEVEEKSAVIKEKSAVIEENERAVNEKDGIIKSLTLELEDKIKTIDTLRNSLSWKITRPVRRLSGLLKGGSVSGKTGE